MLEKQIKEGREIWKLTLLICVFMLKFTKIVNSDFEVKFQILMKNLYETSPYFVVQ